MLMSLYPEWTERIFCCSDKRSATSRRRGHHEYRRFGMKRASHYALILLSARIARRQLQVDYPLPPEGSRLIGRESNLYRTGR